MHYKSDILAEMTNFTLYYTLFLTIPSVVSSLFLGAWTDKYQPAKKALLIIGAFVGICEAVINVINVCLYDISPYYALLSVIPNIFSGGMLGQITAFWSYIALTTPRKYLSLRMIFAELMMSLASPVGTYVGGAVLNTSPLSADQGQLHNYIGVYIICGVAYLLALVWAIFKVDEKRDMEEFER
ncbi:unnamed protein product, partial [Oppiella nova]